MNKETTIKEYIEKTYVGSVIWAFTDGEGNPLP